MAGAEVAIVRSLMGDRDAAEVGADSDQDLPLLVTRLDARRIRLRVRQLRHVDVLRLLDLLLGAVIDVDRLAAPEHLDHLAIGDRCKINLDRRARRNGRGIGMHLRNQWHERRGSPDAGDGGGRNIKKIATCRLGRRHRRHGCSSFLVHRSARSPLAPTARTHPRRDRRGSSDPRHGDAAWRRRANRPLSSCKQGAKRLNPAAFYWHPCQASASGQVRVCVATIKCRTNRLPVLRFGRDHGSLHARKLGPCALRCLSPTFPRTRARFFVSPPASASRRTSSSPRALRPATARSAAPAWITSIRSRSSVTSTGRRSRLGAPASARGSFSSLRMRAALISRTRSGAPTSCCSAAKRRACPRRCTRPLMRGSSFRCEKACARSTWRWPPLWRWAKRCGKPRPPRAVRADAIPIDTAKRERFERTVTEKYEEGEGHLTPMGAHPHPHRSLALSLPTACQVPTQAEADIAPPTSPTPAGFPETMAKKSFAWNFPRPKQWQKKAWLKFSSTRKRCAYVHMTRVWFRI